MAIDNEEMKRFKTDMHNRRQTEIAKENLVQFKKTWKINTPEDNEINNTPFFLWVILVFLAIFIVYKIFAHNDLDAASEAYANQDYIKALELLEKACTDGNGEACSSAGVMYDEGQGIKEDNMKAIEFYSQACKLKNKDGCFNLELMAHGKQSNKKATDGIELQKPSSVMVEPLKPIALVKPATSILATAYNSDSTTCPLTLIADNKNYYVKLCDVLNGNKTVAKFFVNAGDTFKTKIPSGQYMIKFGGGDEWYGEEELFGAFNEYGQSKVLDFTFDGITSTGHTIFFQKMVDGNFKTDDVSRDTIRKDAG